MLHCALREHTHLQPFVIKVTKYVCKYITYAYFLSDITSERSHLRTTV